MSHTHTRIFHRGSLALAVSALIGWAGIVSAAIQVTDSYLIGADPTVGEYTEAPLLNQALDLTNTGFAVGPYNQGSGTVQFAATTEGLNYAPLGEALATSGKVTYANAPLDSTIRSNARALSGVAASDTYWFSHVVNRGSIPETGGDGFVLTGFGNTVPPESGATAGFLEGLYVGFAQDGIDGNFGNLVIRSRTTANQTAEDEVLIDGSVTSTFTTTYGVVMKVDVNVGGGSVDEVSWWLNPQNFLSEETLTSSSAASGSFDSFALQGAPARLNYSSLNWNGNAFFDLPQISTTLEGLGGVVIEETPGDYNSDGFVNIADYTVWRDNLGASITLNGEDPNATTPNLVDAEDYDFWKSSFGAPGALSLSAGSQVVPEPAAGLLWCFSVVLGWAFRRRYQFAAAF